MKLLLRFFGWMFAVGSAVFLVSVVGIAGLIWHYSKDLPDYSTLQDYEPPVMTRVHATDGSLVAEYARERRLYLPIQAVPKLVVDAFLAAEDKNFYEHGGIDFTGVARAGLVYIQNMGSGRRPQGASTITQQVAKNFLLTNEVSFDRKIKEALLAMKIERTYTKDKILELYLNEIYLGLGAYGIAAASLIYYDKSVHELSISEVAYLAALPKAPTTLHPFRARERATERRNYVIDRMVENGYIKQADGDKAKKEPLNVTPRPTGAHLFAAEYFAEEVRREVYERFGEKKLYEGGLSVRATLDPKMQVMARKALADGLVKYDEAQGYRGPVGKIDISERLGHQARGRQRAQRYPVEARGGAGRERPVGAHRLAAGPRDGRGDGAHGGCTRRARAPPAPGRRAGRRRGARHRRGVGEGPRSRRRVPRECPVPGRAAAARVHRGRRRRRWERPRRRRAGGGRRGRGRRADRRAPGGRRRSRLPAGAAGPSGRLPVGAVAAAGPARRRRILTGGTTGWNGR